MRFRAILLGLLALALTCGACKKKEESLSLLVWEGYADPSFIKAFEESHHCKVSASYMGSSDELVAKLRGGSAANYDIISPSSDVAASIARTGLAAALDLSKLPAYSQLSARLLSVWDDLSTVYMAAQVLGYDKPDPSRLYNLTDDQLAAVKKKLIDLKPNIRKMWATGGELTNLFQNHEVVAAMGWPLMTNQLHQLHFPIGETIPKENTTGWIDHLMISAASSRKELATEFLEYMIEAQTQKQITDVTHYTPANPGASRFLTPDEIKGLHLDNPDAYMQRIYFWQDVPRRAKYNEIWNEVKAAQ